MPDFSTANMPNASNAILMGLPALRVFWQPAFNIKRISIFTRTKYRPSAVTLSCQMIDQNEERSVARFMQFTGLPQQVLNANKSLEKVVQSKVLQELLNGQVPAPRITISGSFPFMLNKNEHMLWLFRDVTLQMQKVRRETVGRTRGVSVRVCKGVYYRTGGFRGRPVETTYMQRVGTGSVCLTDKNLYFHCPEKTLKIPFSKILSLDPYSNGLGVQKDGANDKPMFFENLNSWFCYNVISNLK